ncbi:MAG: di-trans,poly-cis-decaprenylcistransferase [Spirochaetaceae bacterium]|nr:di-trans,poly-cis-decaprenylcistransferase [Spirochaetaceae bacterium]
MPETQINKDALPVHIGIIMDGNGRWAQKINLPRTAGHKQGLEAARNILIAAAELGIKYVTLYTFSTENWKRTKDEVGFLMNLLTSNLHNEVTRYLKEGIRLLHLGDMSGLPPEVQNELYDAMERTKDKTKTTVVLAINYGGKDEIVRAVKKLVKNGIAPEQIQEKTLENYFDVPKLPPVDMLIRTGGEKRISNFLLWHAAYAELFFSDTLWPDYSKEEFLKTIAEYQTRTRRFGGVK